MTPRSATLPKSMSDSSASPSFPAAPQAIVTTGHAAAGVSSAPPEAPIAVPNLDQSEASNSAEREAARIGSLLAGLQENAVESAAPTPENGSTRFENHLAMVRLGMATSLYYSLRTKHSPTAAHCLRVALTCSVWAQRLRLPEDDRDRIEVAALLHDLGKIGIPDRILRKPGKLTVDEQLAMGTCPEIACEILRGCTTDEALLAMIRCTETWYDSRRQDESLRGDALPLGARMLSIASAFDAMTTDQVYRPALSRERALQELIRGSGTQFDPELTIDFATLLEQRPEILQGAVVDRWLQQLKHSPDQANPVLCAAGPLAQVASPDVATTRTASREQVFFNNLSDQLLDGVVFADNEGVVLRWNHAISRMTGINSEAIVGQAWQDDLIRLRASNDERGVCPLRECLRLGTKQIAIMQLERPGAEPLPVHVHASPVVGATPGSQGVVLVIRDLSDQTDMERKLETLNQQVTLDALTGVANRAEFDRRLDEQTELAGEGKACFSLVICDIDHFKNVNDTHGHPAGDQALIEFARVLSAHSRDGDLVARYGGEEFLLLTVDCDNATATRRAEAVRASLERHQLSSLGNECVTASFGVTQFQPGDTSETILARADRALLQAKDNGRNRVVQLGSGTTDEDKQDLEKKGSWLSWFDGGSKKQASEFAILANVPLELAVEKLRGFIADHEAEIQEVTANQLKLQVTAVCSSGGRRAFDQHIALNVVLTLSEKMAINGQSRASHTKVHANIQPVRNRDRRSGELTVCVERVVSSLNSYLMGKIQAIDA